MANATNDLLMSQHAHGLPFGPAAKSSMLQGLDADRRSSERFQI